VPPALADQLMAARRRSFVGRRAELALFEQVLAAPGGVVYVHGPGGVGKTTLLRQVAWLAEGAGRRVVWADGRDGLPAVPPGEPGVVLLVDTAEVLGPPDRWLTEELLAALPGDAVAVAAGREPPPLAWRVDPGWRGLVRTVALANLAPEDGRRMLSLLGVPASEHAAALAFTRGHPLALALVADLCARHDGTLPDPASPQVVTTLLAGLLDAVPDATHRAALEACAQVRVTTEPLLAALLGVPEAGDLFEWLRGLSMMEFGPRGLYPHDLARDALAAELRWRHPERYAEIHRRAGAYYQAQFAGAEPAAQQTVISDFAYLHRDNPVLGPFVSVLSPTSAAVGDLAVEPGRPEDHPAVRALVERYEGAGSAALAGHWLARQPEGLTVVRTGAGEVVGCYLLVALEATDATDRATDPAVHSALSYVDGHVPVRAGERALLLRFWLSAGEYQEMSPVCTLISLHLVRHYLTTPGLALTLHSYADPEFWAPACAYIDLARVPEADFTVSGRTYGVYAHDWRTVPPLAWLALLAARETAERPLDIAPPAGTAPPRVLDFEEFGRAVRAALADLGRPDRLGAGPLARSRLVPADGSVVARGQAVQELLKEAAAQLAESPRDRRGYRALHHTYLQPAGSQQRAAELLDLPMSTFRRHLAAGLERLTELLWERELAGR
jgi:hypothetical protein